MQARMASEISHVGDNSMPLKASVEKIQKHVRDLAQENPERRFEKLYRVICDEQWLTEAWKLIRPNKGSNTAGTDGQTKSDVDATLIGQLAIKLRNGDYKPKPVRRVYIPKANGKVRPLGIPTIQDRIVQSALKMLLEPIYETKFRNCSHGFRPQRSCMTALVDTSLRFPRSTWVIEGDIKGCFDNIHHGRLLTILRQTIRDEKLIALIASFLKAGYLEQWSFHRTYSGTPQGGIISPLLANIYLTEFDRFMEDTLKANVVESKKESNARRTKEGRILETRIHNLRRTLDTGMGVGIAGHRILRKPYAGEGRKRIITRIKALQREQRNTPYLDVRQKIGFIRYADDYLVILQKHSKAEAMELKQKIAEYLKTDLRLEQSDEKTLVSHPSDLIRFLGYDLTSYGGKEKGLRLLIPRKKVVDHISEIERLRKLYHIPEADLFIKVNAKNRGWMNYYRYASAPQHTFNYVCHKVFWIVSHYLANRHKTRMPTIFRKYGRTVQKDGRTRNTLTKWVGKKPFDLNVFPPQTGNIYLMNKKQPDNDIKPLNNHEWATGRSAENKILALEAANYQCASCGTTENLDVHHIGGLRGKKTAKQLSEAGQVKPKVVLCKQCHLRIGHHGSFAPKN